MIDAAGSGVEGAVVSVEDQTATATTAADGSFEVTGVEPGSVFLYVTSPSEAYLDGETLQLIFAEGGATVADVQITLSGRPSADATLVGMAACQSCHDVWPETFAAFDSSPNAAAHSRFVTEGTGDIVYPELWPAPGDKFLPRDSEGSTAAFTRPDGWHRRGQRGDVYALTAMQVGSTSSSSTRNCPKARRRVQRISLTAQRMLPRLSFPVAGTIGGQGNWGEGYVDPGHVTTGQVPPTSAKASSAGCAHRGCAYLVTWMDETTTCRLNGPSRTTCRSCRSTLVQDGTPTGPPRRCSGLDVGAPKFWQKPPPLVPSPPTPCRGLRRLPRIGS